MAGQKMKKLKSENSVGTSWVRKFKLLMWKNFKMQLRNKFHTVMEIFIPLMFLVAFAYLRYLLPTTRVEEPTVFKGFDVRSVPDVIKTKTNTLFYTPSSPYWDAVMKNVQDQYFTSRILKYSIQAFDTEKEMEDAYANSTIGMHGHKNFIGIANVTSPILAGIVFPDEEPNDNTSKIEYKLRFPAYQRSEFHVFNDRLLLKPAWFTETLYPVFVLPGPRSYRDDGGLPGYFAEGFLYLQNAIDNSIVRSFLNETEKKELETYNVKIQRFPYPPFVRDEFSFALQVWFNFFLVFAFVYPSMSITKMIVHEKEVRMKEYMKIMGLPNWLHWTAWFLKALTFLTISMILIVILVKISFTGERSILTETSSSVLFLVLLCHGVTVIGYCFLLSALFGTANTAATAAGFMWVLNYIPFGFYFPRINMLPRMWKYFSCFGLGNLPLSYACYIFAMFENDSVGIQWENIFDGVTLDDSFCIFDCMIMMLVNAGVSMIAGFYIELVWPGKYGVPLPWYFPFTKWYWADGMRKDLSVAVENGFGSNEGNFEVDPAHLRPFIEIRGLTKVFGKNAAVKNLNVKFFENQVTSLLGHNGAGKTTTMSMLTGLVTPTSGTALINGYDICKNMGLVRANLGLCPQYNVLFDELTVEEHIRFFSLLKGYSPKEATKEVDRMIDILGFESKRHSQSRTLSGGMKRKLSVGIAFCAGSKAVLLDEPSSGMDPRTRRSTWDLIQHEKFGRAVILSTHFMEEADLLGDRIAIMSHGSLKCVGRSLFLKKKYGGFHNLVIVKQEDCIPSQITSFLQNNIPMIKLNDNVGAELSYCLPDSQSSKFPALFDDLDTKKGLLGISSFGVSNTSMEEVFMRVVKPDAIEMKEMNGKNGHSNGNGVDHQDESPLLGKDVVVDGPRYDSAELIFQQFKAIITKKLLFILRNRGLATLQIFIPIVVLASAMICFKLLPGIGTPGPTTISLDKYENLRKTITLTNCNSTDKICQGYQKYVTSKYVMENHSTGTLENIYLAKAEAHIRETFSKFMIGMEEAKPKQASSKISTEITAFFNNRPFHNPPLTLNFLTNGILRAFNLNQEISVVNHPFNFNDFDNVKQAGDVFTLSFISAWVMQFVLGLMGSAFIIFPIQERIIGAKHLQFVAGVKTPIYWAGAVFVDIINYMFPATLMVGVLILLNVEQFQHWDVILWFFVLCFAHAWSMVAMMAYFSFKFTIPSGGFARMVLMNSIFGLAALMLVVNLESPELGMVELASLLHNILVCFPNYALGMGIAQLTIHKDLREFCDPIDLESMCQLDPYFICCRKYADNFYSWKVSGIGKNLVSMGVFGILCFLSVFCMETRIFSTLRTKIACCTRNRKKSASPSMSIKGTELDEDVQKEAERINSQSLTSQFKTHNLVIRNLTKTYNEKVVAVKKLNLGVAKGETFGLLGVNGAGKTTTFKMITGDIPISSGEVFLCRNSVKRNLEKVYENLGYCPQFDGVIEQLTGRETIRMFARLRGIHESHIDRIAQSLADNLLFAQHLDKQVGLYSGGNKRKLSTAVAMLGNPPVVFLDEPTTGLDPVARRHVWNAINRLRESGTSVVITSHCMEECEALCSRIGIMVDGRFRCLGSPQHLKNKFGEGYSIVAQLNYTSTSKKESVSDTLGNLPAWELELLDLKNYIKTHFPDCELKDTHPGFVQYHIPTSNAKWAKLFAVMEEAKEKFNLEAYSVGQTSLEQVFFNFTKFQESLED